MSTVSGMMKMFPAPVCQIWANAPHNAFTSLIHFRGEFFCAFREGASHLSLDGRIRVLVSADGQQWAAAALLASPNSDMPDLRDGKLVQTPDGRLMLTSAATFRGDGANTMQTYAWFSLDGHTWGKPVAIGPRDQWLWTVAWHNTSAYAIGYGSAQNHSIHLYKSVDGVNFAEVCCMRRDPRWPNESALSFLPDATALSVVRCEYGPGGADPKAYCQGSALLGIARPPYTQWDWHDLGLHIGAPVLLQLPDGRILIGGRMLFEQRASTALALLDWQHRRAVPLYYLPSEGDNSYPGLVCHDQELWISYYSTSNGATRIFLSHLPTQDLADRQPDA